MDAVLFDMDGLLVDTEKIWYSVESEVVERLGGTWGPEHQAKLVGGSWELSIAYMLAHTGADVPPAIVGAWLLDEVVARLRVGVEPMPGALELLKEVRAAGYPVALVTSSQRPAVEPVLDAIGREWFDVVVTANDVTRVKPDPEPYLTAAALLGVRAGECVVLEDSLAGVAAGTAAGCRVVAVPSVVAIPPALGRLVAASLLEVSLDTLLTLGSADPGGPSERTGLTRGTP